MKKSTPRTTTPHASISASAPKASGAANIKVALKATIKPKGLAKKTPRVKLLARGNPQIANADGEAPVQECITMMPG